MFYSATDSQKQTTEKLSRGMKPPDGVCIIENCRYLFRLSGKTPSGPFSLVLRAL